MDLNDIALFVHVVTAGSFAEAGRRVGVPPSTASRRGLGPGGDSFGGPVQGVRGGEAVDARRGRRDFRFHPLRLGRLHERRPLYSRPHGRSAEKGCAGGTGRQRILSR